MAEFQKIDVKVLQFVQDKDFTTYDELCNTFNITIAVARNAIARLTKYNYVQVVRSKPSRISAEDKGIVIDPKFVSNREESHVRSEVIEGEFTSSEVNESDDQEQPKNETEKKNLPVKKKFRIGTPKGFKPPVEGKAAELFYAKLEITNERIRINRHGKRNRLIIEVKGSDRVLILVEEEDETGKVIESTSFFEFNQDEDNNKKVTRYFTLVFN